MANMRSQQEQDIVEPSTGQDHVQSPGKAKGVMSKVKHKARKLKDKVKKATHSSNKAHGDDKHGHAQTEGYRDLHPALAHEGKDSSEDSSDDYDYDSDDQEGDLINSQLKYEQLPSVGGLDKQGDGSDVELHNGVPASAAVGGSYWKSTDDDSPVSIYKSAGPADALQATPTEYCNYAPINDDQSFEGFSDKAQETKPDHLFHDQIGVYSEDLSADRKLGIVNASNMYRDRGEDISTSTLDSDEHVYSDDLSTDRKLGIGNASDILRDGGEDMSMSSRDTDKRVGSESPTASPVDGAQEQIYRPVAEPGNFRASLPAESINASLYGDVLVAEDKLNRSARSGDDPSVQSEEFSFNKENLSNKRPDMLGPERKNMEDVAAVQDKASVDDGDEVQEAGRSTEGWGKWSADKLNNAVDSLALKLASGGTAEEDKIVDKSDHPLDREASDVSYFDPNDVRDSKFQEQFALGRSANADNVETFLDSAVAGSVALVGKLTELKDSITSTLGYGGNETPVGTPRADTDEHSGKERSSELSGGMQESSKGDNDQQQTGFLQGLKETMGSAFGVGDALSQPEPRSEKQPHLAATDSNLDRRKSEGPAREWSLDSASDVPQVAFL